VTDFPVAPDHHVVVEVNGTPLTESYFDGLVDKPLSANVAEDLVSEGENTLTLRLPFDLGPDVWFDLVNLDHYQVTYPRRFLARDGQLRFDAAAKAFKVDGLSEEDVAIYRRDPDGRILRLKGFGVVPGSGTDYSATFAGSGEAATYHVVSASSIPSPELASSAPAVDCGVGGPNDYLIIAHEDFTGTELDPLIAAREADGYRVDLVPVGGLYARYSHDIVDPDAIRACVSAAAEQRGSHAVLLVGADSSDSKDYLGLGAVSFIPSHYVQTGSIVRFAPTDALSADIDGDNLPDVAIGRFPVRTGDELANLVAQTIAYGNKDYRQTAVFAVDKYDTAQGYDFSADAEAIIADLPAAWEITRAYVDDIGIEGARSALIGDGAEVPGALNEGVALTAFFGHSYDSGWTFDGLFTANDAVALTNADRPTVVTQMGCWNTYYVNPEADTLAHRFLLSGNRGAAAVLGPSTLTEAGHEREMAKRLFEIDGLLEGDIPIGQAMLEAKRILAEEHPDWHDVILGWQHLGDPLLLIDP